MVEIWRRLVGGVKLRPLICAEVSTVLLAPPSVHAFALLFSPDVM